MRFIKKLTYVLGWFALPVAVVLLVGLFVGLHFVAKYKVKAAKFDLAHLGEVQQRSAIYDMHGELYSHLPGVNRQVVPLDKVSGWFIQALLAREDSTFWTHNGVEPRSIARAALANFQRGGVHQGASTLTQQLARNAFEMKGRTYDRKATEAALAFRIEKERTKQQILELYVNQIYFGSGFYGIEAAARGYFGKTAAELSLPESAMLAGLIRSPNRNSPARDFHLASQARDEVLKRMQDEQMISADDVAAAKAAKIELTKKPAFPSEMNYATDAVYRALTEIFDADTIERGGLKIFCTLDPELQKNAEDAGDRVLAKIESEKKFPHPRRSEYAKAENPEEAEKPTEYLQTAIVVIDNKSGAIRACVGGRSYDESKYNRAVSSYRQIGSTFKPFVYAAAFEKGLLPNTPVSDDRITPGDLRQASNKWSPDNSDGEYKGMQPAGIGLIKSRNTMTVRVGEFAGLPVVRKLASNVEIGERMPDYPVSFLGAFETTARDLTAAYTTFPNGGVYRPPVLIAKVENDRGQVLYQADKKAVRALRPETAWLVTGCLQEVMHTGTASKASQLGWKHPGAGKTGTTNDFHDAWFVGYTSSLTCGVWVGLDKPQTIMEKGYGSALALPIWIDVMNSAPEQAYPSVAFQAPVQMVKARICSSSGARAGAACEAAGTAYDAEMPASRVPSTRCPVHPDAPPTTIAFGGTTTTPGYGQQPAATPSAQRPLLQPFTMNPAPAPAPVAGQPTVPRPAISPNGYSQSSPRVSSDYAPAPAPAPAPNVVARPATPPSQPLAESSETAPSATPVPRRGLRVSPSGYLPRDESPYTRQRDEEGIRIEVPPNPRASGQPSTPVRRAVPVYPSAPGSPYQRYVVPPHMKPPEHGRPSARPYDDEEEPQPRQRIIIRTPYGIERY